MGELNFFLRLQIKLLEDGTFINQEMYIHEMIKKFGIENSKPMATPMATNVKLTLEGEGEPFDSTKYRGMIGSLLYLTASRPDIIFSVCLLARFQENPMTSHVEAVKRIFRYLKGTMHFGLWYPKFTGVDIMCSTDSDHGGSMIDRKSTSGVCAFVGLCLTSWFLKKQTSIALSTIEAEYVAMGRVCAQVLWMKQTFLDYGITSSEIPICCDNKDKVESAENIADIFIKPLKKETFNLIRNGLGMMEHIP
ncbi:secreted RxLR effector protein 161-like [Rutidosis leptorrhynchoides]|uniref:secreted RxLR effector protein 161-like n=1 Tax=Rutidosis leptorrhynchoides TaxID=125765 RepID=UPI003A9A00D3